MLFRSHATRYRPRLAARWYFEPLERFFASKVQGYLLKEFVRQTLPKIVDHLQRAEKLAADGRLASK